MLGCMCYLYTHRCIYAECSFSLPGIFSPVNPMLSYFVETECVCVSSCAHRAVTTPLSTCGREEIKTTLCAEKILTSDESEDRQDCHLLHDASLLLHTGIKIA